MKMETGYFASPATPHKRSKVHLVTGAYDVPICGVYIKPDKRFQWCATYVCREYVECKRCLNNLDKDKKGE